MKGKRVLSVILALILIFAIPFSAEALIVRDKFEIASIGADGTPSYSIDILDDYLENPQEFKDYIAKEAMEFNDSIYIGDFNLPMKEEVYTAIAYYLCKDIPHVFQVGSVGYTVMKDTLMNMNVEYIYTKEEYTKMYAECEAVAEEMLGDIKAAEHLTDVEKALLIHDRLALRCVYDKQLTHPNKFDIYGALVGGYAVCEGYTKSYIYLLDKVGIKSKICASDELNHAWNIVYIDDTAYHVDVTWDDVISLAGEVYHDNFLVSSQALYEGRSEIFDNGHVADDYDTTPQDTRYDDYFWRRSYSAFQLLDGELYYVDSTRCTINKYTQEENEELYKCRSRWNEYWNLYCRLSSNGEILFYNTNIGVFEFDKDTLVSTQIYIPDETKSGLEIYGFEFKDGYLICDLCATNNYFNSEVIRVDKLYEKGSSTEVPHIPVQVNLITPFDVIYCPVGSELNPEKIQLEVVYQDGSTKNITEGFTIGEFDSSTPGTKTVYITWEGVVTSFDIHVYTVGDANGDSKLSIADATIIQKQLASLTEMTEVQKAAADVTHDQKLSIQDATKIQKYLAGIIQEM
ncbi:MAG: bacterial Ig-like domain-containing protein [Ruminococcus sp.]|nr:bacterial Ig-like domain-containing protein [Ruminococcus sp.]